MAAKKRKRAECPAGQTRIPAYQAARQIYAYQDSRLERYKQLQTFIMDLGDLIRELTGHAYGQFVDTRYIGRKLARLEDGYAALLDSVAAGRVDPADVQTVAHGYVSLYDRFQPFFSDPDNPNAPLFEEVFAVWRALQDLDFADAEQVANVAETVAELAQFPVDDIVGGGLRQVYVGAVCLRDAHGNG